MFPFTAIQKANYRAKFRAESSKKIEKVKLISFWNWWEVHPKEFVPRCLAWRIPIVGIEPSGEFRCTSRELLKKSYPAWFLQEMRTFSYYVQADDFGSSPGNQFPQVKLKPGCVYIRQDRSPESGDVTRTSRPSLDWILNCVYFRNSSVLDVRGVNFSEESWKELLTSKSFFKFDFYDTNIDNIFTNSHVRYASLGDLSLVRVPNITAEEVIEVIDRCPSIRSLTLSADMLEPQLIRKLFSESKIFSIKLVGNKDELKLVEPIVLTAPKQIHLSNFSKVDLTDTTVQSLFTQFEVVYLDACRLTANDVMVLSQTTTTRVWIVNCTISKADYDLCMKSAEASDQPAAGELPQTPMSGDFAKIRYWLDSQNMQILIRD